MQVLIADSAQMVRSALRLLVEDCRPDAQILETRSLEGFFELLQQNHFDVALVDWSLLRQASTAGIATLSEWRRGAYVILLSGHPISRDESVASRADAVVDKGVAPDALHAILDKVLSCEGARSDDRASPVVARASRRSNGDAAARTPPSESRGLLT